MQRPIEDVYVFADGLDHPECVAVHPDGSVWAGGEAGQIYRISSDGEEIREVINTGGFVLGIAFSPDLTWMAICDLKNKCVWKYDLYTGNLKRINSTGNDHAMITPNFPVFDKTGNLYVSDSGNFRQVNGRIWKFDLELREVIWHQGPFSFVNGMALSADQNFLYVVCTWLPGVEQIEVKPDGSAGDRKTVIKIPETCPDGIALDKEGNLYISCYAPNKIFKYSEIEGLASVIHDWESHTICNPTNIAFGGNNHQQLFIANLGRWHIARIDMNIPGLPLI